MNVLIILASIREARQTHRLAHFLNQRLEQRGVNVRLLDLQKMDIPAFGTPVPDSSDIDQIKNCLNHSDAMIFVSPEYHQSYSSTLKSFSEYYWPEFSRKPIGVATASAGKLGGVHASMQLQSLVLALGGYPIPIRLMAAKIHELFDQNNQPLHSEFEQNTKDFLDEFISFGQKLCTASEIVDQEIKTHG